MNQMGFELEPSLNATLVEEVRYSKTITDRDRVVHAEICAWANHYGFSTATPERMAEDLPITVTKIKKSIDNLVEHGYLWKQHYSIGKTILFTALWIIPIQSEKEDLLKIYKGVYEYEKRFV